MKPEEAAQTIRDKAPAYGEAKAQRVYLDEFRKSKKALLMKNALEMGYVGKCTGTGSICRPSIFAIT